MTLISLDTKELIDTDIPAGKFMLTVFTAFSQLGIDSFRASRLPKHYTSTLCESLSSPTGQSSSSSMENESQKNIIGRDFMRRMDMFANTFYRRVREYEIRHGIAEQTSA